MVPEIVWYFMYFAPDGILWSEVSKISWYFIYVFCTRLMVPEISWYFIYIFCPKFATKLTHNVYILHQMDCLRYIWISYILHRIDIQMFCFFCEIDLYFICNAHQIFRHSICHRHLDCLIDFHWDILVLGTLIHIYRTFIRSIRSP